MEFVVRKDVGKFQWFVFDWLGNDHVPGYRSGVLEKHLNAVGLTESGRASNHPGGPLTVDLLLTKKRNSGGSQAPAKLSPEYLQRNRPRSLL